MDAERIKALPAYKTAAEKVNAAVQVSRHAGEITDQARAERATEILVKVVDARKDADASRLEATKPYRDAAAAINTEFKEMVSPLDGAEQALKEAVRAYQRKRQAEIDAENRRLQEAARRKQQEELKAAQAQERPPVIHQPAPQIKPETGPVRPAEGRGSVSTRKVWKFEVEDGAKVPIDYRKVDEVKIRQAVAAGVREIPGVRIFEDEVMAVRR